ncbi:batten's disease protein Cln3 [Fomitiporia mediterranea MF3/22]|uniref:batten's disease protein Cln3 n=1 Tax=Fomitiporia mediterranea (strain MF3/22) TaxID=694068 RepID=UPI0004407D41|nr:batten's disease protein Cln3 [Fomitiporia mediterranea MF3/22]EJD01806.1 batten's disease protein Cln3 [Fomitiporia mediterranea MF3/22]
MAPEEENLLEHAPLEEDDTVEPPKHTRTLLFRLGLSFFLFGLINNVLYVIILSAALDLVPPSTPKGIIAFCNIAPSLVAKVGWPYLLKGRIRYIRRILGCWILSTLGMIVVAGFDTLEMRLLGISLASFSSGLGELTFLQRSTTYRPPSVGGRSVGYFASGTGAAGLVGAFIWWEMRSLGVRTGVGISAIFPLIIPLTYFFILPRTKEFLHLSIPDSESADALASTSEYAPIPETDDLESMEENSRFKGTLASPGKSAAVALSAQDKWELVKPLLLKYMLPLSCVYLFEYTINQGIAPTLVYPVPAPQDHPLMSLLIHSIRDYYPLWQLVYQTTVFLSRSSISLGLPPLPGRLLSMPAIVQFGILVILALESGVGLIPADSEGLAAGIVFVLISIEGVCGGLAYVNVFYRINQSHRHSPTPSSSFDPSNPSNPSNSVADERLKQEHEFQIGSIGFADSSGILLASLVAMPTEVSLCKAQIARGKMLCGQL